MAHAHKSYKPLHEMIKFEDLPIGVDLAITINPEVQFTGWDAKRHCLHYSKPHTMMKGYMQGCLSHLKYTLYDLHYELSPTGRQHYHGTIQVTHKLEFFTRDVHILQSIGSICMRVVTAPDEWTKYCLKQALKEYRITTTTAKATEGEPQGPPNILDYLESKPKKVLRI